jgi:hypothetical protein
MKDITVYLVNYVHKRRTPIGSIVERREVDRGGNLMGLLKQARKQYASTPDTAFQVCLEKY